MRLTMLAALEALAVVGLLHQFRKLAALEIRHLFPRHKETQVERLPLLQAFMAVEAAAAQRLLVGPEHRQ